MAKYSKAAGKKVETVMKEMKSGKLKSGSGKKVTDKKQAVAIGLSEARKNGAKVPSKTAAKKSAPKKAAAKKAAPKKSAAKKAAPKKGAPKKAAPKKGAPKKAAPKKGAPKKAAPKKSAPKKSAPKKAAPKKSAAPKKGAAPKKAAPKKAAPKKAAPKKQSTPRNAPEPTTAMEYENISERTTDTENTNTQANDTPVEENTERRAAVEEPDTNNAIIPEAKGSPIPADKYAAARDTYHGHTNPTSSKSSIKPSGKKPLWNK